MSNERDPRLSHMYPSKWAGFALRFLIQIPDNEAGRVIARNWMQKLLGEEWEQKLADFYLENSHLIVDVADANLRPIDKECEEQDEEA